MSATTLTREQDAQALLIAFGLHCRMYGGDQCYQGWSVDTLREYINFHINQMTFAFVQTRGRLIGTGVVWQCQESELRAAAAAKRHVFQWQPTNPAGDTLFIADIVCSEPGALESLLKEFARRFPRWRQLKLITFRNGRLVRYPARVVRKLTKGVL